MRRSPCSLLCLALAFAALALAGDPDPEPNAFQDGWDKPTDPDKDCTFKKEKGGLTITVPGKDHGLAIERGRMNAPRLLRDVEGDFVAEVRVSGTLNPSMTSTAAGRTPFLAGGLVLMADEKTYIRLERAAYRRDDVATYANWELRQDGNWLLQGNSSVCPLKEKAAYLRLERKGDRLLASVSEDGKEWSELSPLELKLPAKLKLGVTANSTCTDPFSAHFDRFKLRKGKRDAAAR
jgi:regulation of enolase protein 1 (concanavalin A-like superfamily)